MGLSGPAVLSPPDTEKDGKRGVPAWFGPRAPRRRRWLSGRPDGKVAAPPRPRRAAAAAAPAGHAPLPRGRGAVCLQSREPPRGARSPRLPRSPGRHWPNHSSLPPWATVPRGQQRPLALDVAGREVSVRMWVQTALSTRGALVWEGRPCRVQLKPRAGEGGPAPCGAPTPAGLSSPVSLRNSCLVGGHPRRAAEARGQGGAVLGAWVGATPQPGTSAVLLRLSRTRGRTSGGQSISFQAPSIY